MLRYPKTYQNWSENLNHPAIIQYPTNNEEIIGLITQAKTSGQKIRVVGAAHASSPVIAQSEANLILLSLAKYSLEPRDYHIDPDEMTVKVNAGWTLAQLYDELNKGLYFLETQTAGAAFSVGGVISTPVHGGRLGGSLMADSVMALTMIDGQGKIINRTADDDDFQYYRLNLGLSGIIISVTFRIHQMLNVQSNINTIHHAFIWRKGRRPHLNYLALSGFFWDRITYSLNGPDLLSPTISRKVRTNRFSKNIQPGNSDRLLKLEPSQPDEELSIQEPFDDEHRRVDRGAPAGTVLKKRARYTHCFMDFHNNSLTALDWIERKHVRKVRFDSPESTFIPKVSNLLHRKFFVQYRQRESYLKMMGRFIRVNIENSVRLNQLDDQDMLWINFGTQVYFMSYYVPIYTEGEVFEWTRVAQPFEVIMETISRFREEKRAFMIDFPLDFRFVTSSSSVRASPLYSTGPRKVFLVMDLTCGPGNINLDGTTVKSSCWRSKDFIQRLNADFHEFYSTVETKWRELGAIPHWGKLFGFSTNSKHPRPFQSKMVKKIFSPELKAELLARADPLFSNDFTKLLLSD